MWTRASKLSFSALSTVFGVVGISIAVPVLVLAAVNQPAKNVDCSNNAWQTYTAPAFSSEQECKQWVHTFVSGHLWMTGPSQEIEFNANNVPQQATNQANGKKGKVHYINFEYPGGLDYTTDILCTNSNRVTDEARFMFQIPEGHPGLSGLYVVVQVSKGRHATSDYGHAATADEATATQWCETGVGFSPTNYDVTRGWVRQDK